MAQSKIPAETLLGNSSRMTQMPVHPYNTSYATSSSLYDPGTRNVARPPLPPPRYQNSTYSSYSSPWNNNGYSGYSSFNRPYYGGYNSYSPYQPSYFNSFSDPRGPYDSRYNFTEAAQESSREAFANIERIVHTFGSVNMMIESTYYALQSSFNAVLSVAENLSRLKFQFGQILSAFTLIRSLQWLYKKLLFLIGLRKMDPSTDSAWKDASRSLGEDQHEGDARKSSWPILIFMASIYIGPFLMWKFINLLKQKDKDEEKVFEDTNIYAVAKYDYKAQHPEELSFSAGDHLKLAPYEKQANKLWPLASNGKRTGIVPGNYIDIKLNSIHSKNREVNSLKSSHRPDIRNSILQTQKQSHEIPSGAVKQTSKLNSGALMPESTLDAVKSGSETVSNVANLSSKVNPDAVISEAVNPDAVISEAVNPDAVISEAVNPDAVISEAVNHDAVISEAINPDAVISEAVNPDAVISEAVNPDAVISEAVNPDAVISEAVNLT